VRAVRRFAWAVLIAALAASHARAQAPPAEPSERVCSDFRAEIDRAFAAAPESLQINNLLFEAARNGCFRSLDRLFKAGASRLARDREGDTALAIAARAGRKALVDILISGASAEERRQLDAPDG